MGLFDTFKKKSAESAKPLSSRIEKTPSVMAAVPLSGDIPRTPEQFKQIMLAVPFVRVISQNEKDGGAVVFTLEYMDEEYKLSVVCAEFELPKLFAINQHFTEREGSALEAAKEAVYSRMVFGSDNQRSFHLQIKLMCALVANAAGIADFSGERIFPGRWAKLTAASEVAPAASCLHCVQCIGDEDSDVWLHTHGLNRCGSIELEILNSSKDNINEHAAVINTLAANIITKEPLADEFEPQFCVRTPDGGNIVTTWVNPNTALKKLPKITVGGASDRADGHNENTGIIFVYPSQKDYEKRKLSEINIYNNLLKENPLLMISTEETNRMRALALERISYLRGLFGRRDCFEKFAALVKIGLEVDEQYREGDMKEHIWFEIKEMNEDGSFSAELTQEPYYISSLKEGDIRTFTENDITDWMVFTENGRINPDAVYLLEE